MKKVDQSVLHDPENGKYGDCQRACIASLLELDIEEVPHFAEVWCPLTYYKTMNQFLAERGLVHIEVDPINFGEGQFTDKADCYHMIYGLTERGTNHATVGLNGKMIHDPHPSRAGLIEVKSFAFLVGSFG
jgi:hypothetical protein